MFATTQFRIFHLVSRIIKIKIYQFFFMGLKLDLSLLVPDIGEDV
jgi:hypothetical protein